MAFGPDNKTLVIAFDDVNIGVMNANTGKEHHCRTDVVDAITAGRQHEQRAFVAGTAMEPWTSGDKPPGAQTGGAK